MEQKNKLIPLINKQITIEKEQVKKMSEMEKVGNAAAKLLFLEMCLDSEEYAAMLTGILDFPSLTVRQAKPWIVVCGSSSHRRCF